MEESIYNDGNLTFTMNISNITSTETQTIHYWATLLVVFVFATLFGNILVVIAVVKVRSLQSVTNYLIVSLALADITVGALVMPFAVYEQIVGGKFPLHPKICDSWVAVDVLACTASILMMTAISIDRFLAVNYAVTYTHRLKHSMWYPVLMITICWVVSIAIALPILVGSNNTSHRIPDVCAFFNPLFSMFSSMGSFFIPTTIMIVLYWKIFQVIKQRAALTRERLNKQNQALSLKRESSSDQSAPASDEAMHALNGTSESNTNTTNSCQSNQVHIAVNEHKETFDDSSDARGRLLSTSDEMENSSTNKGSNSYMPSKPFHKKDSDDTHKMSGERDKVKIRKGIAFSPSKRRDKRERRERRATITLVVVLCVFLICWIPFFLANNLGAICLQWSLDLPFCHIPDALFYFFVWLGYMNSMLNPVIYALLNSEYRKAFKQILCCVTSNVNRR